MLYLLVTHKRSVRITANNNLYIASFPASYESSLHLWSWSLLATLVSSLQGLRKFAGTEATWRISGSFKELRQPKGTEAAWGVYFCHSGLRRWGRLKELRQPDGSIFATLGWGGEAGCRNWGRLKGPFLSLWAEEVRLAAGTEAGWRGAERKSQAVASCCWTHNSQPLLFGQTQTSMELGEFIWLNICPTVWYVDCS